MNEFTLTSFGIDNPDSPMPIQHDYNSWINTAYRIAYSVDHMTWLLLNENRLNGFYKLEYKNEVVCLCTYFIYVKWETIVLENLICLTSHNSHEKNIFKKTILTLIIDEYKEGTYILASDNEYNTSYYSSLTININNKELELFQKYTKKPTQKYFYIKNTQYKWDIFKSSKKNIQYDTIFVFTLSNYMSMDTDLLSIESSSSIHDLDDSDNSETLNITLQPLLNNTTLNTTYTNYDSLYSLN